MYTHIVVLGFSIFSAKNQLEHPVVFSKRGFLTENHFLSSLVGTATSQDNHPSITFFRHFFTELSNVSSLYSVPNRCNVLISVAKFYKNSFACLFAGGK